VRVHADDLPAYVERLEAWAAARPLPVETRAYGAHPDQLVELRQAGSAPRDTLVLVIHGGFWRTAYDRSTMTALSVALVGEGFATANVEYRRLGPGAWRPMLDDVLAARRALGSYGRAVAVGHSAGGHLALWLALQRAVDGAVALGGVCDLAAAAHEGLGDNAVQELLGGEPDGVPAAYAAADPAAHLPLGVPQRLVHGTADDRVPIGHARAYAQRACAAGDDCRVVEVDCGHFEVIDPRSTAWPAVAGAVRELA
jgi:acetyl esterase/lipase